MMDLFMRRHLCVIMMMCVIDVRGFYSHTGEEGEF